MMIGWMVATAVAAPPQARDYSNLANHLQSCPIGWQDLFADIQKSGLAGMDSAGLEYAVGWVYPAWPDPVSLTLYDDATDTVLGGAVADDQGQVTPWGDVIDMEPVRLARNCAVPTRSIDLVRVYTAANPSGLLLLVR